MLNQVYNILLEFLIVYLITLVIYYLIFIPKGKKKKEKRLSLDISYLEKVYNINNKEYDYKKISNICMFTNCLIMDIIYIILSKLVSGFIWQLIIGFILLILLIVISYGIIGRILNRRKK